MRHAAGVEINQSQAIGERIFADFLSPLIEPGFRLALGMLHDPAAASFTAWRKIGRIPD